MQQEEPTSNGPRSGADESPYRKAFDGFEYYFGLWLVGWLGTIVAGMLLGFVHLFPWGCVLFAPLFAVIAAPIFTSFAIVSWGVFLHRFYRLWIGVAGGVSGAAASLLILGNANSLLETAAWAALGGVVVAIAALVGAIKFVEHHEIVSTNRLADRQFSLGQLFLRTAVLAWLATMWSLSLRML